MAMGRRNQRRRQKGLWIAAPQGLQEVVADRGYHSNEVLTDLTELELRSYINEPDRGRRKWCGKRLEQQAVYGNRRRMRGERGKRLSRLRGERVERSFLIYMKPAACGGRTCAATKIS